jgi:PAS domain S-box-containing protein
MSQKLDDRGKNTKQLLAELAVLRKRVTQLETAEVEHRKMEEMYRESAEKFSLVFENAHDGISIYEEFEDPKDPENRKLVECNERFAEMAGRSRKELLRIGITRHLAKTLTQDKHKSFKNGNAYSGLFSWIRPDEKDNIVEYTAMPIKLHGKTFTIGIDRDITERKRMEEQILLQKSQFQQLFENISLGIALLDEKDRIIQINKQFENIFQYHEQEIKGKFINDVIVPLHLKEEGIGLSLKATHVEIVQKETLRKRKDGTLVDVLVLGVPIQVGDKQTGIFGIYEDITERIKMEEALRQDQVKLEQRVQERTADLIKTNERLQEEIRERKRIEEALRESSEKFRMVFENAFDGISIFEELPDPDQRRLVDCNSRYAEYSGRSRVELLKIGNTHDISKSLSEDERLSIEQGNEFRGTFSWIRPDGKDNIIEYTAVPIKMQGKTYTIGIDRDVTKQRQTDAEREKLITELQNALADIKTLSGLVPICSNCKKIRDDKGYWTQVEAYIQERSQARFSHGICPDCMKKLYPNFLPKEIDRGNSALK